MSLRRHRVEPLVGPGVLSDLPLGGKALRHQAPQLGIDLALGRLEEEVGDAALDELAEVVAGHLPPGEEAKDGVGRCRQVLVVWHVVPALFFQSAL